MKRKLIKVTHIDGSVSYTIKVRVLPFIWITQSESMGYYDLVYRNMDFEHAKAVLKRLNEQDAERRGHRIKRIEVVKIDVGAHGIINRGELIMTNEERGLLLKDLCGRLHTFLYVNIKGNIQVLNSWADDDRNFFNFLDDGPDSNYGEGFILDDVKPYLRPMSSMTDEEKEDWYKKSNVEYDCEFKPEPTILLDNCHLSTDWLNEHHFDYRGLIEKGLALEAPEGMYKID